MSMCYNIICKDCKKSLWVGQSGVHNYIYKTFKDMEALEKFLFAHEKHDLIFGDDNLEDELIPEYGEQDNA